MTKIQKPLASLAVAVLMVALAGCDSKKPQVAQSSYNPVEAALKKEIERNRKPPKSEPTTQQPQAATTTK